MTNIMITGIARGIGYELARQSQEKGWKVFGSVRSQKDKSRIEQELPGIKVLVFDVTEYEKIDQVADALDEPIDILINNAGIISPDRQSTLDMDFEGFAKTLAVNTLAPLKISHAFLPHLKSGNDAAIITISSAMGLMQHAKSDRIAYRASKTAVNKIMQALATDLSEDNICVVAMHPGWVQSDMGGAQADITPQTSAEGILKVAESLTMEDTCTFINWDGERMAW